MYTENNRSKSGAGEIIVNGIAVRVDGYLEYHRQRIDFTLNKLRQIGAHKLVEVGSHPWAMTASLIDQPELELCATVSAEELTCWPDDIGVSQRPYQIKTSHGNAARFTNYAANIERTLFDLAQTPDTVIACEIVEHLIRSPHVMFLNINRWLPLAGKLLVSTPNGAQFANPLWRKSPTAGYRCHVYERHAYLYTLDELVDLVQLCGFKITDAGYCDVYRRAGPAAVYGLLARLPSRYCREKFMKTIYLVAEKATHLTALARPPRVYDGRGDWELIQRTQA